MSYVVMYKINAIVLFLVVLFMFGFWCITGNFWLETGGTDLAVYSIGFLLFDHLSDYESKKELKK